MSDPRPRPVGHGPEIETISALDSALASAPPPRTPAAGPRPHWPRGRPPRAHRRGGHGGARGRISPALQGHLHAHRALIFPTDPHAPVNPYRATLYQPHELYAGLAERGYEQTPDAEAYHWSRDAQLHHDAFVTLLRAIHDDSVTDALTEFIDGHPVVGVMGGHALERGTTGYAVAARLGHALATDGLPSPPAVGPGRWRPRTWGVLRGPRATRGGALARLAAVPSFRPDIAPWAKLALQIHDEVMEAGRARAVTSVGIPTWFYGHEPRTCSAMASPSTSRTRYARTASRALHGRARRPRGRGRHRPGGLPGRHPAVLLAGGQHHPTSRARGVGALARRVPIWAGLQALARGRGMETALHLVDDITEVPALLRDLRAT